MACMAQAQTVSVSVPSKVMVGETFRLQYTVNTKDVDGKLQLRNWRSSMAPACRSRRVTTSSTVMPADLRPSLTPI